MKFLVATLFVALAANAIAAPQHQFEISGNAGGLGTFSKEAKAGLAAIQAAAEKTRNDIALLANALKQQLSRLPSTQQTQTGASSAQPEVATLAQSAEPQTTYPSSALVTSEESAEETTQGPFESSSTLPTIPSQLLILRDELSLLIDDAMDEGNDKTGIIKTAFENIISQLRSARQRVEEARLSLSSGRVAEGKDSLEYGNRAIGSARGSATVASQKIRDGLDAASSTITEIISAL